MKAIKNMGNGLNVVGGRLVNNRPDGVTGLQQAIEVKNALKREKKISMMEDAYVRAEVKMKILGIED